MIITGINKADNGQSGANETRKNKNNKADNVIIVIYIYTKTLVLTVTGLISMKVNALQIHRRRPLEGE